MLNLIALNSFCLTEFQSCFRETGEPAGRLHSINQVFYGMVVRQKLLLLVGGTGLNTNVHDGGSIVMLPSSRTGILSELRDGQALVAQPKAHIYL